MRYFRCDRCKKVAFPAWHISTMNTVDQYKKIDFAALIDHDLCDECYHKLYDWIKEGES